MANKPKRICNRECAHHSEEWRLSTELAKSNKRLTVALLIIGALWISTLIGALSIVPHSSHERENANETELLQGRMGRIP